LIRRGVEVRGDRVVGAPPPDSQAGILPLEPAPAPRTPVESLAAEEPSRGRSQVLCVPVGGGVSIWLVVKSPLEVPRRDPRGLGEPKRGALDPRLMWKRLEAVDDKLQGISRERRRS
jgi:hypothetical protein